MVKSPSMKYNKADLHDLVKFDAQREMVIKTVCQQRSKKSVMR